MDALFKVIFIAVVTGVTTSILASLIHKMNWHKRIRKCKCEWLRVFITNLYQFNYLPFNIISLLREIGFNLACANFLFLFFICEYDYSNYSLIFGGAIIISIIRALVFMFFYSKFYDEKILNEI
jgi:hypothetical protein